MTNEDAIEFGKTWLEIIDDCKDSRTYEFFQMAIKALEQEPCEDAISRQAVLEIQAKYAEDVGATKFWQMRDDIKALPPVTPQLTEEQIQKMQELEQAEIQKAYELGKAESIKPCEDAISRQAVIKYTCESKECYKDDCKGRLYKRCYDLQWIYDLPSVKPQPKTGHWIYGIDEDCVSRQEVLDALDKSKYSNAFCEEHHIDCSINLGMAHIVVNELKPVTPQQKTVLYSGDGYADGYMVYDMAECPNCGYEYEDGDKDWSLNFCPNCGQSLNWESEVQDEDSN